MRTPTAALALVLGPVLVAHAGAADAPPSAASYRRMVDRVAALPGDDRAQQMVERRGLEILNVLWEDTGRRA